MFSVYALPVCGFIKKKVELFLEESIQGFDANAHKYYFQFMLVFKPMSWASNPGLFMQGLGVRGDCMHTLQGFPKLTIVYYSTVK